MSTGISSHDGNVEMALYKQGLEKKIKERMDIIERLNSQLIQVMLRHYLSIKEQLLRSS